MLFRSLVMENTHDNSAENPANPNRPPRRIGYGEQTTNEMSAVLLDMITHGTLRSAGNVKIAAKDLVSEAEAIIKKADRDKDGKLTVEELAKLPGTDKIDLPAAVKRFDKDGDGKLNAAELAEAIAVLRGR